MAEIGELGFFALAFAIEPGFRIGGRDMRGVRSLLAVEIDLGIAVVALFFVRRGLIRSRFTGRRYLLTLRCRLGIRTGGRRQLWPLVRGRCRLLRHKTLD